MNNKVAYYKRNKRNKIICRKQLLFRKWESKIERYYA